MDARHQALRQPWIIGALLLFGIAGVVWVPALALKVRLRNVARATAERGLPLPATFHRWVRWWLALWWTIFALTLAILALMVLRPSL